MIISSLFGKLILYQLLLPQKQNDYGSSFT